MVQAFQKKLIGSLAISEKKFIFFYYQNPYILVLQNIFSCIFIVSSLQMAINFFSMAHSFSCNLQIYRKNSTINLSELGCPISGLSYKYKLSLFSVHCNLKFGAPAINYYISMQAAFVSELSHKNS